MWKINFQRALHVSDIKNRTVMNMTTLFYVLVLLVFLIACSVIAVIRSSNSEKENSEKEFGKGLSLMEKLWLAHHIHLLETPDEISKRLDSQNTPSRLDSSDANFPNTDSQ